MHEFCGSSREESKQKLKRGGQHAPEGGVAEELDADRHEQQGRRREDCLPDTEAEAAGAAGGARARHRPVSVLHPLTATPPRRRLIPSPYALATLPSLPNSGANGLSVVAVLRNEGIGWNPAGGKSRGHDEKAGALRWMGTGRDTAWRHRHLQRELIPPRRPLLPRPFLHRHGCCLLTSLVSDSSAIRRCFLSCQVKMVQV